MIFDQQEIMSRIHAALSSSSGYLCFLLVLLAALFATSCGGSDPVAINPTQTNQPVRLQDQVSQAPSSLLASDDFVPQEQEIISPIPLPENQIDIPPIDDFYTITWMGTFDEEDKIIREPDPIPEGGSRKYLAMTSSGREIEFDPCDFPEAGEYKLTAVLHSPFVELNQDLGYKDIILEIGRCMELEFDSLLSLSHWGM